MLYSTFHPFSFIVLESLRSGHSRESNPNLLESGAKKMEVELDFLSSNIAFYEVTSEKSSAKESS